MIQVEYRIRAQGEKEARRMARALAVEQTVEVPEELITPEIEAAVVGEVREVHSDPDRPGAWRARVAFDPRLCGGQLPQLLNLIYGNTTLQPGVRVLDLKLPESLLARFPGPRYGVEGTRRLLGVYERPLLASALKPNGAPLEHLVRLAGDFAAGGGDLIKDDQNLVYENFEDWRERVTRCREAVHSASDHCLYLPWVGGPLEEAERRLEYLMGIGVRGYLIGPFLMGLEATRSLAARFPLLTMAHPSFAGVNYVSPDEGLEPGLVLGMWMRWIGMDISIFVNVGGRFAHTREMCLQIARRCTEPLGDLAPTLPCPAGGMRLENLAQMAQDYGRDACLLIGGALLAHPGDLRSSTAHFLDRIRAGFGERRERPAPAPPLQQAVDDLLAHRGDWTWEGRDFTAYKDDDALPHRGVRRCELLGNERTAFELRYFEVEPGGHTSLEKHVHTHALIGVRGEGILVRDGGRAKLRPWDVAYVDRLVQHQLRNEGPVPFGFFCIVDRKRDRPLRP